MSGLTWFVELIDKVSKPAATMADKVGQAEKAMHGAAEAVTSLEQKQERAAHSAKHHESAIDKLNEKLREFFFTKEAIKTVGEIWEKVSEIASESLNEMRFKQDSLLALEAMRGTREEAIEIFEGVEGFAAKTGQGVQDVMRVTKDLLASSIDPESVDSLRLMLADLRVVDTGKADSVAAIIGEIGRRGEMTSRQMIGLSNAGIDAKLMWEALSRETGYSVEALRKMDGVAFKAGTAIKAIYSVGVEKYGKGVAGSLAEREAKTLPTLINRVKMIPELMMSSLAGFDRGAGGGVFERALSNVADAFLPGSETSERIIGTVRSLIDSIAEAFGFGGEGGLLEELAGPNGPAKVAEIIEKMAGKIEKSIPDIKEFAASLSTIAGAIIDIGKAWASVSKFKIWEIAMPATAIPGEVSKIRRWFSGEDDVTTGDSAHAIGSRSPFAPGAPVSNASLAAHRSSSVSVTVNVHGNASKEDAEHIGRVSAEAVGQAHEQHAIQMGAQ